MARPASRVPQSQKSGLRLKTCVEKQVDVCHVMRRSKLPTSLDSILTFSNGFSECWRLGLFLCPVGHRERPSGHSRNEIRKERKATKPTGQLSNDKSTWHRIGTRFSASYLGVFHCLWHLGSHFTYSRGYLWMLASIWLAPPRNLQGSRSELVPTRQALRM